MIQLELTPEEAQHLQQEVKTRLTQIDREIDHTDSLEFKELLKARRESVRKFLLKLPDAAVAAA